MSRHARIRRTTQSVFVGCVVAAACGCQSTMPTDVYISFEPGGMSDALGTTFDWSPPAAEVMKKQEAERPFIHRLILESVNDDLARKGYARAAASADLWVAYEVNAAEQVDAVSGIAYTAGIYGLSIFDARTSRRIYTATAKIRVNTQASPDEARQTVEDATRRMLEKLPRSKPRP